MSNILSFTLGQDQFYEPGPVGEQNKLWPSWSLCSSMNNKQIYNLMSATDMVENRE